MPVSPSYLQSMQSGQPIATSPEARQFREDYGRAVRQVPRSILDYIANTPVSEMGSDVAGLLGAIAQSARENPLEFAAGFNPYTGAMISARDTQRTNEAIRQAEAQGDTRTADNLRQMNLLNMLGSIPFVGGFSNATRRFRDPSGRTVEGTEVTRANAGISDSNPQGQKSPMIQRIGDIERSNEMVVDMTPSVLNEIPIIQAEQIVDRPYVSTMADISRGGLETVRSINGTPMNVVVGRGGQDYMFQPNTGLWASEQSPASGILNASREAAQRFPSNRTPLFAPYQMKGNSTDFATMTLDLMVPYAQRNMSNASKQDLDRFIRNIVVSKKVGPEGNQRTVQTRPFRRGGNQEWRGLDDPNITEYLYSIGGNRKYISDALDRYRDAGSLSISQARNIIADPNQYTPTAGTLLNVGEFFRNSRLSPSTHPTYSQDISGRGLGRFNAPFTLAEANPYTRLTGTNEGRSLFDVVQSAGRELNPLDMGSETGLMKAGLLGYFDQNIVDDMIRRGVVSDTGLGQSPTARFTQQQLPPASNAQRTQLGTSTIPTYSKANDMFTVEGRTLDYGAGRGLGAEQIGADTFEPFPMEGFNPTFSDSSAIPSSSYPRITSLNVLNVMPREARDQVVRDIGRILEPNGEAIITTRGRDVMSAQGVPQSEPMSIITSRDTYQKGFTQSELREYVQDTLGENFEVVNAPQKIGAAGIVVRKLR